MTDIAREWIVSREGLIATFSKPFRDMPQDKVGLSIMATNDFPRALAALEAVLELHYPEPYAQGPDYCAECEHHYPCPTARAIAAAVAPTLNKDSEGER